MKKNYLVMLIVLTLLISNFLLVGISAEQEDFPTKPVEIIIPFSVGGSGDILSRALAPILETYLGVPVICVTADGGSGAVGIARLMSLPADGYAIFHSSSTLPYTLASGGIEGDPYDLLPLVHVSGAPQVMSALTDSSYETFEDFVAYAKDNPGVVCGGSHINGTNHIFFLKLMDAVGLEATYIPYTGGGENMLGLLGKDIEAGFSSAAPPLPYVQSGEVRILGVTGSERDHNYPDAPTFKELGYPEVEQDNLWRGFFIKKGTPQHIVDKWREAFAKAVKDERWEKYINSVADVTMFLSGNDFEEVYFDTLETGYKYFGN